MQSSREVSQGKLGVRAGSGCTEIQRQRGVLECRAGWEQDDWITLYMATGQLREVEVASYGQVWHCLTQEETVKPSRSAIYPKPTLPSEGHLKKQLSFEARIRWEGAS